MPAYNAENYISQAITSCLNQTYSNFELIIINDGSIDNTIHIINGFIDKRIKVISISNSGQCIATNIGIAHSTGNYIQFLDADDYISFDKLYNQVALIGKREDSIVYSKWVSVGISEFIYNHKNRLFKTQKKSDWFFNQFYYSDMLANSCYLIPRHLIEKAGYYNENLNYNNDFEYFNRIVVEAKSLIYDDVSISFYRRDIKNSITSNFTKIDAISEITAKILTIGNILNHDEVDQHYRKAFSVLIGSLYYKLSFNGFSDLIDLYDHNFRSFKIVPCVKLNNNIFSIVSYLIGLRLTLRIKEYIRHNFI
jgi:glycosyltransferase involved in cell wall biosynthesis